MRQAIPKNDAAKSPTFVRFIRRWIGRMHHDQVRRKNKKEKQEAERRQTRICKIPHQRVRLALKRSALA